eukprot:1469211-Rhodomonas_salina.1
MITGTGTGTATGTGIATGTGRGISGTGTRVGIVIKGGMSAAETIGAKQARCVLSLARACAEGGAWLVMRGGTSEDEKVMSAGAGGRV